MEPINFLVRVNCMTFNQASYIEDALNGFTMQETTFPFVCTIFDDASTDGEQEAIKRYLESHFDLNNERIASHEETNDYNLTFSQHRSNKNCYFAVFFLKYNHYSIKKSKVPYWQKWFSSKYIALCEGDDYWIDKQKLQRQVDYLESHPDFMMHFHNALVRYQNHNCPDHLIRQFQSGEFNTALLFKKWQLPTASVLFRSNILEHPTYLKRPIGYPGDITLFITASRIGKVYGLSECLSIYRKNDGGISNSLTDAKCLEFNLGLAIASGDNHSIKYMKRKAIVLISRFLPKYLLGSTKAKELVRIAWGVDKKILFFSIFYSPFLVSYLLVAKIIKKTF